MSLFYFSSLSSHVSTFKGAFLQQLSVLITAVQHLSSHILPLCRCQLRVDKTCPGEHWLTHANINENIIDKGNNVTIVNEIVTLVKFCLHNLKCVNHNARYFIFNCLSTGLYYFVCSLCLILLLSLYCSWIREGENPQ